MALFADMPSTDGVARRGCYIDEMAIKSFGVRELRNSTADVIEAALDGHDVYISVNGTPKVRLVPIEPATPMARVLADAAALKRVPSTSLEELLEAKEQSKAAQVER